MALVVWPEPSAAADMAGLWIRDTRGGEDLSGIAVDGSLENDDWKAKYGVGNWEARRLKDAGFLNNSGRGTEAASTSSFFALLLIRVLSSTLERENPM